MTARVLHPVITLATVSAVLLAALAVYLVLTAPTPADADTEHYDATNTQTLGSTALGAARSATTVLSIPTGDHNFSNNVSFEPAGVSITPSCNDGFGGTPFRDYNDNGSNDGAPETPCIVRNNSAGTQTSDVFLGVANSTCSSALTVVHDLFAVPTPNNELDPRASTNIVYPHVEGTSNRFQRWRLGGPPTGDNGSAQTPGTEEEVKDVNANTQAEGDSFPLMNYPSFMLDLFDPDFAPTGDNVDGGANSPPVVPLALYGGVTAVTGTWVPLYYAVFDVGDLQTAFAGREPSPFTRMDASLGYPTQAVLNDPTALQANPSSITDFCTSLVANNALLATVGGVTRATNPTTGGTHVSANFTSGLRDADNDSYENSFDTCPKNANVDDPRTDGGDDLDDFDFPAPDMLDPACDPTPSGTGSATNGNDHDYDGFANAQDTCPTAGGAAYSPAVTLTNAETNVSTTFEYTSAGDPIALFDYIKIDEGVPADREILRVVGIDTGTNTLTVKRAVLGDVTPHAHDAGDAIIKSDLQVDSENSGGAPGLDTAAIDGGPAGDSLNDNCDSGSIVVTVNNKSVTVNFATGVGNGHWHSVGNVMPKCYGGTDADADGYCAGNELPESGANCTNLVDNDGDTYVNDGCPQVGATAETGMQCNNATDDDSGDADGVVNDGCPAFRGTDAADAAALRHGAWTTTAAYSYLSQDFDTDRGGGDVTSSSDTGGISPFIACPGGLADNCPENGFDTDWIETYIGTDPALACNADTTQNNEDFDAWWFDINDDTRANNSDIILLGPVFNRFTNQTATAAYSPALTLTGGITAADTSFTYTSTGDAVIPGHTIQIDTEIMLVLHENETTNTLTVERGILGTTAAAHAAAAGITRMAGTRTDVNSDGITNNSDLLLYGPVFNKQCRRDDGTLGQPQ